MSELATEAPRRKGRPQDPEGTKRNIVEVAIKEFADHGLSGSRIDEIAAKTNSSKRMIYYYFGDKQGLYLRCLEQAYRDVRTGEVGLDLAGLPPQTALQRLIEFTFDHHASHRDFIRLVMIENIHNGEYLQQSDTIRELNATAIDNLQRIYERGVDAGVFRSGLKPINLHWQISALCFFNVSNEATFTSIFGGMGERIAAHSERRAEVVDMLMRYVTS